METKAEYNRRYQLSEKGKAAQRRYQQSARGKITHAAARSRYEQGSKGKTARIRYLTSKKGRLYLARRFARWHGGSGFIEYLNNAYQMIHVEVLPCIQCGETDKDALTVDHIVPRGLGGTHKRENLQVLCRPCHKVKTVVDIRHIYASRSL